MRRAALAALLAYVMPSQAILKHMVAVRDGAQLFTLRVDGSATLAGAALREAGPALALPVDHGELQVEATVSLKLPERCRLDLSNAEGGKQLSFVVANGKRRGDAADASGLATVLDHVCALLAQRSSSEGEARTAIERHIHQLGVQEDATSLARFGGQVAYVVGESAEEKAQLWIYKDSFQPARLRFVDPQGSAWDLHFLDYTSPATGEWFPRTLEVFKSGELQLRLTALKADSRTSIPDKLFASP